MKVYQRVTGSRLRRFHGRSSIAVDYGWSRGHTWPQGSMKVQYRDVDLHCICSVCVGVSQGFLVLLIGLVYDNIYTNHPYFTGKDLWFQWRFSVKTLQWSSLLRISSHYLMIVGHWNDHWIGWSHWFKPVHWFYITSWVTIYDIGLLHIDRCWGHCPSSGNLQLW